MSADLDSIAAEEADQQNAVEDDGYEKSADGEDGCPKQKSIQWRRNVDFTPNQNGVIKHNWREKNFELAVKDLDYIKMKCLGTDTRRSRTAPVTSVARNLGGISGDQSYARSL
ncbi:hypothetical protein EB796_020318 [Bugula neritina]|uniref:Uncharacterized protein n=1 Tax=Bugula neritina TaxID=10212 RepID=A0A7J7J5F0_BUGNE|nr:hypothetical protein EB796_020318 [Bugula neritina]